MNPVPTELKSFLDECYEKYNSIQFIETDPILIPRQFSGLQDIEIMGLWTAILSWGQRKTIINKGFELVELMGGAPHEFIVNHKPHHRKPFEKFKHRTFQGTDAIYFLEFFQQYYQSHESMESLFCVNQNGDAVDLEEGLHQFHSAFFSLPYAPQRTRKHIPTPKKNSCCKRMNMFLRWMVREDNSGVDFGCWKKISSRDLFIPLDVHVDKVARKLGLLRRKQTDWKAVMDLTEQLKRFDPDDPVKYDFALFGLGVLNEN